MIDEKTLRYLWEKATPEQKKAAYEVVRPKDTKSYNMEWVQIFAEMAHGANLIWGQKYNIVVDTRSWKNLKEDERRVYIERFDRISRMTSFPCFDNDDLAQDKLTASYLHKMWLQTAKDDHPAKKAWEKLTPPEQFKGTIYLNIIKFYQSLIAAYPKDAVVYNYYHDALSLE